MRLFKKWIYNGIKAFLKIVKTYAASNEIYISKLGQIASVWTNFFKKEGEKPKSSLPLWIYAGYMPFSRNVAE